MTDRVEPPYVCCSQATSDTGHGHFICRLCGKKYDRFGRDVAKEMRGVDIDRIHRVWRK